MIPRATYRMQFHKGFTFADASALVPYLSELGISHLYASPIFAAREGSTNRLRPGVTNAMAGLGGSANRPGGPTRAGG